MTFSETHHPLPFDLLFGSTAPVVSASSILMILILMFIVTFRLYKDRKKKGYRSISLSLLIIIIQYIFILMLQWYKPENPLFETYTIQFLQVIAFIFINMGMYQLYNHSRFKQKFLSSTLLVAAFIIAGIYYYMTGSRTMTVQETLLQQSFLDVYLFLLIFLCFYLVAPYVGQRRKYYLGLTVFFMSHLSYVANQYVFQNNHGVLKVLQYFLPISYYSIVFLFVLDRVIELLQQVYRSAITDGLTGLYNRNYFNKQVDKALAKNMNTAVIFTDIDNFKKLNDTLGHQAGDDALCRVADILKQEAEGIGLAGRYGGEELVMLIVHPKAKVSAIAEQVRKRVETEAGVTVSVGYSKGKQGIDAEELTKQADEAMYISKTTGKNKVTGYSTRKKANSAES
ncbi:GGDEF domain-containing protein [Marinicrinis lubricantis]|uniref:GGDEF domain-containing protein n=1 Tax=Marinicrinis lubricantis TaxID=2086470 RepID=A0ABW1ITG4_9BACL